MKPATDQRGFSLIEILVVIVIIGIAAMAVMYTMQPNVRKQSERFAHQIVDTLHSLQQYATLTQSVVGVDVREDQLQFFVYYPDEKNPDRGSWALISPDVIDAVLVAPKGVRLSLGIAERDHVIESEEARAVPEIIFSINGRVTPFEIKIILQNGELIYRIRGEVSGQVHGQRAA